MNAIRSFTLIAGLGLALSATAASADEDAAVFQAGSQYTAALQPAEQIWRLAPLDGQDVELRSGTDCPHTALPAAGLWLVGRDAQGLPELVAPSATRLGLGQAGRIALRPCDHPALQDASRPAYGVPSAVLQLLIAQTGAVLVHD